MLVKFLKMVWCKTNIWLPSIHTSVRGRREKRKLAPVVVLMKWRIKLYVEKDDTLLPNKVRARSSVIINRSE